LGCHLKTTVISVSCEPSSMLRAYCGGPQDSPAVDAGLLNGLDR
jgi:hypothetical protein